MASGRIGRGSAQRIVKLCDGASGEPRSRRALPASRNAVAKVHEKGS